MRYAILTAAAIASAASLASADIITYDGPGGLIPDAGAGSLTLDRVVPISDGAIQSLDRVAVDLHHTWVGDLLLTLTHVESGRTAVLLDRPGAPPGFGNSDDLDGVYLFIADGETFPETASPVGVVTPGSYQSAGDLTAFAGGDTAGTWRLFVGDNAGGDTGAVRGWSFTVTTVPTPGAVALAGLGMLAMFRRRRTAA